MALGSIRPLTEMSTRCISWDKGGRCVRLTTLSPFCAVVMKSGSLNFLEPSGPLQSCNGTALPYTRPRAHAHARTHAQTHHNEKLARTEVTGWRGWRRNKVLDDLREKKGHWKLKEEALDLTVWRTRFGRGYGPVIRQTTGWRNETLHWNRDFFVPLVFLYALYTKVDVKVKFASVRVYVIRGLPKNRGDV